MKRLVRSALRASLVGVVACTSAPPPSTRPPPPTLVAEPLPPAPARERAAMMSAENCVGGAAPKNPVDYGTCHLELSKAHAKSDAKVTVVVAGDAAASGVDVADKPESYAIVPRPDGTLVVGRDPVGAMYGALEVAERLDMHGASALPLTAPLKGSPSIPLRGANLVVILPEAARPWWFREPAFWVQYLDMMARARLNFLDMHGMYDLTNTRFANPLLYFADAPSYPQYGIPKAERDANMAMLRAVLDMCAVRGIHVGLMGYRADLSLVDPQGDAKKEKPEDRDAAPGYSLEAVADFATKAPGFDYIGFRIGESNRKPEWYVSTYIAALKKVHSHAAPYTRTWGTTKPALMPVVEAGGPETILESKFNGEQLGSPYAISGGNMEAWKSYSYEDFLTPPTPYKVVFQVRAGGTHRIFRYASFERTRRTVQSLLMSPRTAGFSFEAAHAYLPMRDFYHADPKDSFSPYAFRRDELSYLLFGRLGYDPTTPESVFRAMLAERVGTDALWEPVQAASDIVPWHIQAHTCGVDQRQYAPDLELGGPVAYWASPHLAPHPRHSCEKQHEAFDEFAAELPAEAAVDLLTGQGSSRLSPVDIALIVLDDAKKARASSAAQVDPANAEARDVVRECGALADLGDWLGHKLRGATALAVYEGSNDGAWLDAAKAETLAADAAYVELAKATAYISPFEELMRMERIGLRLFHWEKNVPRLAEDMRSIDEVVDRMNATRGPRVHKSVPEPKGWLDAARRPGPGLATLDVSPNDPMAPSWVVTATFDKPVPAHAHVRILFRTFISNGPDWAPVEAAGSGTTWKGTVPGTHTGAMFAVEVNAGPGQAWRYPDVTKDIPYKSLAP